jgi:hypothetical protein
MIISSISCAIVRNSDVDVDVDMDMDVRLMQQPVCGMQVQYEWRYTPHPTLKPIATYTASSKSQSSEYNYNYR